MKLVKGYRLVTMNMTELGLEQLYALDDQGEIKTCVKKNSHLFVEKGVDWYETDFIPEDADYIGLYKM